MGDLQNAVGKAAYEAYWRARAGLVPGGNPPLAAWEDLADGVQLPFVSAGWSAAETYWRAQAKPAESKRWWPWGRR